MAIDANLQQFKSSGIYRLTFDKSQTASIPAETIRLVVGFSKKGPFNTPIFVPDPEFFTSVFGNIDRKLERKGSFFHRTALQCLDRGPIIVLNLLSLNDATDKTDFISFSTAPDTANKAIQSAPLAGYYNSDKFWFLDEEDAFANIKSVDSTPNLLNFANVGRKNISVLVRKADVTGFDITAKEWYGVAELPEFLNGADVISDYMLETLIIEGDYSNNAALQNDPVFGPYFDDKGLKKTYTDNFGTKIDGIDSFINLPEVKVLGKYIGSIIPDFVDKNGTNLFIEDMVNADSIITGALCTIDKSKFDDAGAYVSGDEIDFIGHQIENGSISTLNFLSYSGSIKADNSYTTQNAINTTANAVTGATVSSALNSLKGGLLTASTTLAGAAGYSSVAHFDIVTFYAPGSTEVIANSVLSPFATTAAYTAFVNAVAAGKSYVECSALSTSATGTAPNHALVKSVSATTEKISIQIEITTGGAAGNYIAGSSSNFLFIAEDALPDVIPQLDFVDDNSTELIAFKDSGLYTDWANGGITTGDNYRTGSVNYPIKFTQYTLAVGTNASTADGEALGVFSHPVNYVKLIPYTDAAFTTPMTTGFATDANGPWIIQTLTGNLNQTISPVLDNATDAENVARVSGTNLAAGVIKKGDYLVSGTSTGTTTNIDAITGKSRLTKVKSVSYNSTTNIYTITAFGPIYRTSATGAIEKYEEIDSFATHYKMKSLKGFTMRDAQIPNGQNDRQNEILNVMYTTNIKNALIDRDVINFRYIIDTFNGGIEGSSKSKLSKIAKDRQNAFAILNTPSVKNFKDSTDPLFKADVTKKFDARFIADGGNQSLNPTVQYSLPPNSEGGNFCAFYGPNLIVRERGKNISVPQAAWVSNLYIDKFTSALPWSIIAGPRRGVIGGGGVVGLEYNFDRADLDFIEPFGINAIVAKKGLGFVINANQTAQQSVKSALSQAHVRELIIYIQDGIEAILKNYRWEFNTAQNRLEIKTLADGFLGQILNDSGVYDFQNIMDSTNNTADIIDSNMGILDTYIEPARGMGILVHRTTILKTGAISTGDFI